MNAFLFLLVLAVMYGLGVVCGCAVSYRRHLRYVARLADLEGCDHCADGASRHYCEPCMHQLLTDTAIDAFDLADSVTQPARGPGVTDSAGGS